MAAGSAGLQPKQPETPTALPLATRLDASKDLVMAQGAACCGENDDNRPAESPLRTLTLLTPRQVVDGHLDDYGGGTQHHRRILTPHIPATGAARPAAEEDVSVNVRNEYDWPAGRHR